MAQITLAAIKMDTGIQCRAAINTEIVNDYAERMTAADKFPPVDLFGNGDGYWIGDGWHRIMAAQQIGAKSIDANVNVGNRQDALKCALHANALHGARRTNADKRRCVDVAVAEFVGQSSRVIAEMCGVTHKLVLITRRQLETVSNTQITGRDGRQYNAKHKAKTDQTTEPTELKRNTPAGKVAEVIGGLLNTGHNIDQICQEVGRREESVRRTIRRFNLFNPSGAKKSGPKIVATRVIRETVNAVVATSQGLRLIDKGQINLPKDEASVLLKELRSAMKSLQSLVNILKGLST